MTLHELTLDGLTAAAGLGAAVLLLKGLPIRPTLVDVTARVHKAVRVIRATGVSDHWKERVVPRYALSIMLGTSRIAAYLLAMLGTFIAGFVAAGVPFGEAPGDALARLLRWEPQLMALAMGTLLVLFLRRRRR